MSRIQRAVIALCATFKALCADKRFLTLTEGNKKLIPSESVKYLIFNLPAKVTCPFSTALCRIYCYAKSAERYDGPRLMRQRNYKRSMQDSFVADMIFTISAHLTRPKYSNSNVKQIVIRIHESGDFYSREYVKKWLQIARAFKHDNRIVFMCYTKSVRYFVGLNIPDNMKVRFSVWSDTQPEEIAIAEKMGLPIYTAVEKFTNEKAINRCLCNDCSHCCKCWHDIDKLLCEIH